MDGLFPLFTYEKFRLADTGICLATRSEAEEAMRELRSGGVLAILTTKQVVAGSEEIFKKALSTLPQLKQKGVLQTPMNADRHQQWAQSSSSQNQSFNPFIPESQQMVREVGNIELFELLETEPKAQCKVCLSYWDIGIVYCTCGHFFRKGREERIRNSSNTRWTSFPFPTTSSRKDDFTDIDMVKSLETGNTLRPTS